MREIKRQLRRISRELNQQHDRKQELVVEDAVSYNNPVFPEVPRLFSSERNPANVIEAENTFWSESCFSSNEGKK